MSSIAWKRSKAVTCTVCFDHHEKMIKRRSPDAVRVKGLDGGGPKVHPLDPCKEVNDTKGCASVFQGILKTDGGRKGWGRRCWEDSTTGEMQKSASGIRLNHGKNHGGRRRPGTKKGRKDIKGWVVLGGGGGVSWVICWGRRGGSSNYEES